MEEMYWNDTDDDGDRKRRRQAEFLVRSALPLTAIRGIGVRTEEVKSAVVSKLKAADLRLQVLLRPAFYYEGKP